MREIGIAALALAMLAGLVSCSSAPRSGGAQTAREPIEDGWDLDPLLGADPFSLVDW